MTDGRSLSSRADGDPATLREGGPADDHTDEKEALEQAHK